MRAIAEYPESCHDQLTGTMTNATATLEKPEQTRQQWLEARRNYLGGTDVAALVGRNKYASPLSVYTDKVLGQVEKDPEDMEAAEMGILLEPFVKSKSERECGWVLKESKTYYHPEFPFLAVNPDAELGSDALVEIKTHGFRTAGEWGEENTDQIPDAYHVQCVWQLGITGKKFCFVVAFDTGLRACKYYRVEADPEYFLALVQIASAFWNNHVLTKTPPDATGHKADAEAVQRIYPFDMPVMEVASEDDDEVAEELVLVKAQLSEIEDKEAGLKAKLQASIGDSEGIKTMSGDFKWKASKDTVKTDWKGLCAHLLQDVATEVRDTLVAQHSVSKPGSRRFTYPTVKI